MAIRFKGDITGLSESFKEINQINKTQTSNLSASKSRRAPSEVSVLVFLAMYPSM